MVTRLAAAGAALGIAAGAVIFWTSVLATQGWRYPGFISEAGVPGSPHVGSYRLGILILAAGLVLLGFALRHPVPVAAGLVATGGLFSSLAGAVNCSTGCPLPPYEVPTFGDMVHAVASIAAVLACVAAMTVCAAGAPVQAVRRLSQITLVLAAPLVAVNAILLLAVGRSRLTGETERVLLLVTTVWAVAVALTLTLTRHMSEYPPNSTDISGLEPRPAQASARWGGPLR